MPNWTELPWIEEARLQEKRKVREIGSTNTGPEIEAWGKSLNGTATLPAWLKGVPWCGFFVGHCLQVAGFTKGSVNSRKGWDGKSKAGPYKFPFNWYGALDYIREGGTKLTKPAYGCVAVKTRSGGGHVCFVVGKDKTTGKLVCLGGNQGDKVCFALYNASDFEAFMWYGKTPNPAEMRYNLPVIQGVTGVVVKEN